jgi:hypothetical protein
MQASMEGSYCILYVPSSSSSTSAGGGSSSGSDPRNTSVLRLTTKHIATITLIFEV